MITYDAIYLPVLNRIPQTTHRLLDLGRGSGSFGRHLKKKITREIVGLTFPDEEAAVASQYLDKVIVQDLNDFEHAELGVLDCIVCSHVLEQLYQPQELLNKLRQNMTSQSTLIVALPNIMN